MGGFCHLVELHWEGSERAACAAAFFLTMKYKNLTLLTLPSHPSLEGPGSPKVLPMESVIAIFCLLVRQTDRCYSSWILMGTF